MTTAVMEPTQTMTLADAESAIREWQDNLDTARATLAETEQGIGQVALAEGVSAATEKITRLQVEVKMAETALAAAQSQRDEVRQREQLVRAEGFRAELVELDKEAQQHGAVIRELEPKLNHAHQQIQYIANRMSTLERQIGDIEYKYGKETA